MDPAELVDEEMAMEEMAGPAKEIENSVSLCVHNNKRGCEKTCI